MRNKKRGTNIKILQRQLQDLAVKQTCVNTQPHSNSENSTLRRKELIKKDIGGQIPLSVQNKQEVPLEKKIKKKGVPKDELINTKRLLTM